MSTAVSRSCLERGLMYVAMRSTEEMLAFTRSTLNGLPLPFRTQELLDQTLQGPERNSSR